jgi:hypothetical protein
MIAPWPAAGPCYRRKEMGSLVSVLAARFRRMRVALCAIVAIVLYAGTASVASPQPLETAVMDLQSGGGDASLAVSRVRGLGATKIRITANWIAIAPSRRSPGFNPRDPNDPRYDWSNLDQQVVLAERAGLDPIVCIVGAPPWAEDAKTAGLPGARKPDPVEFGRFAHAAALRYSGSSSLPRVRYWQAWNEPNLTDYLAPQFVERKPFAPGLYRRMVNAFAAGVKAVHADNVVVAGGTSPFRDVRPQVQKVNARWGPLTFMRELFCLSRDLKPKCRTRVRLDVWAHHPYTSGGPTHHALLPDDVSLGDLPEMRAVLKAAHRRGMIQSRVLPRFWVTEFSWDTAPPDPAGLPLRLHARWTAEALYRMWQSGVSLVTWLTLRDEPWGSSAQYVQGGLYFRGKTLQQDRAKPAATAFRFPFVSYKQGKGLRLWGRTPSGTTAAVAVEQRAGNGWRRVWTGSADRYGIFRGALFARAGNGSVRARILPDADVSLPFSLAQPPDRPVCPFGSCETGR